MGSGLVVFVATLAVGGVTLWGALREGWIGWLPRRRKPAHKAPSLVVDVARSAWEMWVSVWDFVRDFWLIGLAVGMVLWAVVLMVAG